MNFDYSINDSQYTKIEMVIQCPDLIQVIRALGIAWLVNDDPIIGTPSIYGPKYQNTKINFDNSLIIHIPKSRMWIEELQDSRTKLIINVVT